MASKRKRIFLSPPHMGGAELDFVREAFASNYIAPLGPMVDTFEQEFSRCTGLPYCLAVSSGTAAIHLALRHLGITAGDFVLASTATFIGGIAPITYLGATPVFVDCDRQTWNMDPSLLQEALDICLRAGRKPKAVLPTDLYGQCADYDRIDTLCRPLDIPVLVDAAESLGATYRGRPAGKGGWAAAFSFNGNKIITTSGGGMLASGDKGLIEHARNLSQQAREPFPHYQHREIGYNYRMSNILAAIGRGQLRVLDERLKRRREIHDLYERSLAEVSGLSFMPVASYGTPNHWLTVLCIDAEEFGADREIVRCALEKHNIESRPVWMPMHMQPVFKSGTSEDFKAWLQKPSGEGSQGTSTKSVIPSFVVGGGLSEKIFQTGLCLPSGTMMSDSQVEWVAEIIRDCQRGIC